MGCFFKFFQIYRLPNVEKIILSTLINLVNCD